MNIKEEIREAGEVARSRRASGDSLLKIAEHLNLSHDGFYYVSGDTLYRENVPEYAPPVCILKGKR